MFRPKKQIKLEALLCAPEISDLQRALGHAHNNKGSTVELPWQLKDVNLPYTLAVRAEFGPTPPVWTLYAGEGGRSRIVWSAPFTDLELLKEVVSLTIAEAIGSTHTNIPALDKALLSETRWQEAEQEIKGKNSQEEVHQPREVGETSPPGENKAPTTPQMPGAMPIPYAYYYPGYPYPIPYPYAYPTAVTGGQTLGTVPLQAGVPAANANLPNPELFNKQRTFLLGEFFVEAGLIASEVLKIILKLQEMIAKGLIDTDQALEHIRKEYKEPGSFNISEFMKKLNLGAGKQSTTDAQKATPLLGEILVKAQIINNSLLLAVLKLQEVVRSGAMTQEEACQALKKELGRKSSKTEAPKPSAQEEQAALTLLTQAGLLSKDDEQTAYHMQQKHGGTLATILAAAGKVSKKSFFAAIECHQLLTQKKIKLEQAAIALNYCERSRVGLDEAITDLGWHHL